MSLSISQMKTDPFLSEMDEPKHLIASKKAVIHHHFASTSFPSVTSQCPSLRPVRKSSNFRATEAIYMHDKDRFTAGVNVHRVRLPKVERKERPPRYKSMRRFEPRSYRSGRKKTADSLSPKKPLSSKQWSGCWLDGYPHSLTNTWGASKELLTRSSRRTVSIHSLQPALKEKVGSVIEKCKEVERSSSQLKLVKKEKQLALSLESFINVTERTLEQLNTSPGELLIPMYAMRREADSAILLDAQQFVHEDRSNLNETTNKITRMIEREARRRKNLPLDG